MSKEVRDLLAARAKARIQAAVRIVSNSRKVARIIDVRGDVIGEARDQDFAITLNRDSSCFVVVAGEVSSNGAAAECCIRSSVRIVAGEREIEWIGGRS